MNLLQDEKKTDDVESEGFKTSVLQVNTDNFESEDASQPKVIKKLVHIIFVLWMSVLEF